MTPLADLMRPKALSEIAGQEHLCGKNGILTKLLASENIPNLIFYGPPGIGKTTAANIIADTTKKKLVKLNGTTAGTADIKAVVDELDTMLAPNGVLLYLDEIQYFNKKQQQSLLSHIENGKITLIASTTENPYFYVYPAVLSRSTVIQFHALSAKSLLPLTERAAREMDERYGRKITLTESQREIIATAAAGDARKCIGIVEFLCLTATKEKISDKELSETVKTFGVRYDREGDNHYDILSAFQKSIRGSDPDAALHYMARLIAAGDLPSLCRRLLVTAAEDIGLAYPMAITIAKSCVDTALMVGLPEAGIPLAEAVIMLATAPKSNSGVTAMGNALADVHSGKGGPPPLHLQDTHYSGAKKLGKGGYIYPHGHKNNYVKQQYLPDELVGSKYYSYGDNKTEAAAKKYWDLIKGEE